MKQEKHEKLLVPYVSDGNLCEEVENGKNWPFKNLKHNT
jgi:hypothetical protein